MTNQVDAQQKVLLNTFFVDVVLISTDLSGLLIPLIIPNAEVIDTKVLQVLKILQALRAVRVIRTIR